MNIGIRRTKDVRVERTYEYKHYRLKSDLALFHIVNKYVSKLNDRTRKQHEIDADTMRQGFEKSFNNANSQTDHPLKNELNDPPNENCNFLRSKTTTLHQEANLLSSASFIDGEIDASEDEIKRNLLEKSKVTKAATMESLKEVQKSRRILQFSRKLLKLFMLVFSDIGNQKNC
uniref:Uncharacterized protein n=1 Tax=Vespula pensylvanica TaxID=30213 RepID=A0A834NWY5_VESPE|nr:hypothetical protein H0235_010382 [Vespula pensylvanica]